MEVSLERECSALGGLFHQIISDMKNGTPLWEDLVAKASKLHSCLRATIQAIASFLEAFQKIADAATNARGATREIGTALTRICLRHKAVETRMKTFTSAIVDCFVVPLQEKLEDWKKIVVNLDKDHAKEYKRARAELKKRSSDTLRLQKKARKVCGGSLTGSGAIGTGTGGSGGGSADLAKRVESGLADMTERRQMLENTEKNAVRAALLEERARFCTLAFLLRPVIEEEIAMLSEMSHLQEVVDVLHKHTADPHILPPASEQVIADLKGADSTWSFQTPPSSPSSLGSRKSSMCSISSLNSSSSGSTKSHHSPSHHYWHRTIPQRPLHPGGTLRLSSVSSQDSGFTSHDGLQGIRRPSALSVQASNPSEHSSSNSGGSTPSTPHALHPNSTATATWPNLQETLQFERAATAIMNERPHTISSAYEQRSHTRPPLTIYTFHDPGHPNVSLSQPVSPVTAAISADGVTDSAATPVAASAPAPAPPLGVSTTSGAPSSPQNIYAPRSDCGTSSPQPIYATLGEQHSTVGLSQKPQGIYARPPVIPQRCSSLERPSVPSKSSSAVNRPAHYGVALSVNPHTQHLRESNQAPTYVNMHELACMAASKAQEMNFLPPPLPPEMPSNSGSNHSGVGNASGENPETKTDPPERDGSTSESSLESSSGYGSQTAIPVADDGLHGEGIYGTGRGGTLLRRGSVQGQKPPPPMRRTSSITSTFAQNHMGVQLPPQATVAPLPLTPFEQSNFLQHPPPPQADPSPPASLGSAGSIENLPPPPAYLLDPDGHDLSSEEQTDDGSLPLAHGTVKKVAHELTEKLSSAGQGASVIAQNAKLMASIKKQASPSCVKNVKLSAPGVVGVPQQHRASTLGRMTAVEALRAGAGGCFTGPELMRTSSHGISIPVAQPKSSAEEVGLSVADAVRTLTELKHTPASPVSARRSHSLRSQSAERKSITEAGVGLGGGGVGSGFIAAISAKLGPTLSPRHSRRHSEDLNPSGGTATGNGGAVSSQSGFRESLNARLALSHQNQSQTLPSQHKASKVRQWINMRSVPDPATCHDSLMDQIKRGKALKKTGGVNDRSAPRIH